MMNTKTNNLSRNVMRSVLLILILSVNISIYGQKDFETLVRQSVERQLQTYPASTLQDLYKNFFQDHFGPEHIITDTVFVDNYLKEELRGKEPFEGALYEPTGYQNNYYRVNLRVIQDGLVDYQTFLALFLQSSSQVSAVDVDKWKAEWAQINNIISDMKLSLPHYEQDSIDIQNLLQQGQYALHHSRAFNEAYHPHYRIISKELFNQYILPLLKPKQ